MKTTIWCIIILLLHINYSIVFANESFDEESDSESFVHPHIWSSLLEEWATK